MKTSRTAIAVAAYCFMAWRTGGWKGLVGAFVAVTIVAVARIAEKEVGRDMGFWLDLVYWSVLFAPFFLK